MRDVNYDLLATPPAYVCSKCGAAGVKLWRPYQSSHPVLRCVDCTEKHEGKPCQLPATDQIGWSVPAVPDEEGIGFWGYTSVPERGCKWWYNLPLRAALARAEERTDA